MHMKTTNSSYRTPPQAAQALRVTDETVLAAIHTRLKAAPDRARPRYSVAVRGLEAFKWSAVAPSVAAPEGEVGTAPVQQRQARRDGDSDETNTGGLDVSLDRHEMLILQALERRWPQRLVVNDLKAEIEAEAGVEISDRTLKIKLTRLITAGLASRPTPRTGATITAKGRRLLRQDTSFAR